MNTDGRKHLAATSRGLARTHVRARALTFSYVTTAITSDKTFRERQISICLTRTPGKQDVNTKSARTRSARATRDAAAGTGSPSRLS